MGFFIEIETEWLEFKGAFAGWKVLLKKEMDAGDQESFENATLGVDVQKDAAGKDDFKPLLRQGGLRLMELCVLKIIQADGKEIVPTPEVLKSLNKAVAAKIKKRIGELNRPLAEAETAI